MAVLLFAMTTAVMGCYQKDPDPIEAPSGTSKVEATPIPTVNRQAELADAKSRNPDAVAWLYIPGAEVDDPVMQRRTLASTMRSIMSGWKMQRRHGMRTLLESSPRKTL